MNKKIAVAGTGYVGLSIATLLAQHNHVVAVDIVPEKVEMINNRCHGPRKVRIMCPIENPESRVISAYKRVGRLLKSAHRMR